MEARIKFASPENLGDILNLNHQLCIKENKEFDATINKDYPIQKSGEEYFKERVKNDCALVALADGKAVGYLVGAIIETEDYRNISKLAEVENMFVLEEYRNSGIGKKLFDEFIKWCKSNEVKRIRVVVSVQNIKAIKFYKREGLGDYNLVLEKEILN